MVRRIERHVLLKDKLTQIRQRGLSRRTCDYVPKLFDQVVSTDVVVALRPRVRLRCGNRITQCRGNRTSTLYNFSK